MELEIKVIGKSENDLVNKYLKTSELHCKCSNPECTYTLINSRTENSFYLLREYFGKPIIITSGFRCLLHNTALKGASRSYHMLGSALDIKPVDPQDYNKLLTLAEKFFDYVKPYRKEGFIHVHQLS